MFKTIRNILIFAITLYAGAYMIGIGPATVREMFSSGVRPVLTRQVVITAQDLRDDYSHPDGVRKFGDMLFNLAWEQSDSRQKALIARYLELQRQREARR